MFSRSNEDKAPCGALKSFPVAEVHPFTVHLGVHRQSVLTVYVQAPPELERSIERHDIDAPLLDANVDNGSVKFDPDVLDVVLFQGDGLGASLVLDALSLWAHFCDFPDFYGSVLHVFTSVFFGSARRS